MQQCDCENSSVDELIGAYTLQALSTRKSLKEKYQPMNIFALGELISELNKVCIGPDDDPRDLFTQIRRLCNRFEPEVQITTDMKYENGVRNTTRAGIVSPDIGC